MYNDQRNDIGMSHLCWLRQQSVYWVVAQAHHKTLYATPVLLPLGHSVVASHQQKQDARTHKTPLLSLLSPPETHFDGLP